VRARHKRKLTPMDLVRLKPGAKTVCVWDALAPGLALRLRPSGRRSFYFVYNRSSATRWYRIGLVPLAEARKEAMRLRVEVLVHGRDPAAERTALRRADTLAELHAGYLERHAKKENRSWPQAAALISRHVLPRLGKKRAREIERRDVRETLDAVESKSTQNQVLASLSAVYAWAVEKEILAHNPCAGIKRNEMKSRERTLSDDELRLLWPAMSSALRAVLLTAQRPGEIYRMRFEHLGSDGWWRLPGLPQAETGWGGTKNGLDHAVPLSRMATKIVGTGERGFVFPRRPELTAEMRGLCARFDVKPKITPHDLRRTARTWLAEAGFPDRVGEVLLNHVDPNKVRDTYNRHKYKAEMIRAVEAVAARVRAVAEGRPPVAGEVVLFPSKS
jgi:integrase